MLDLLHLFRLFFFYSRIFLIGPTSRHRRKRSIMKKLTTKTMKIGGVCVEEIISIVTTWSRTNVH